jgi:hypothetical protein
MENVLFSHSVASSPDADGYPSARIYLTEEANGFMIFLIGRVHTYIVAWYPTRMRNQAISDAVHSGELPYHELVKRAFPPRFPSLEPPSEDEEDDPPEGVEDDSPEGGKDT